VVQPDPPTLQCAGTRALIKPGRPARWPRSTGVEPDLNGRILLISALTQAKDLDGAERECRALVALQPGDLKAELLLADVLTTKKAYTQARAIYERALKARGDDPDIELRLARVALWSKYYDEAARATRP
jgi:tetratricopeptide (TPR) repeat protein